MRSTARAMAPSPGLMGICQSDTGISAARGRNSTSARGRTGVSGGRWAPLRAAQDLGLLVHLQDLHPVETQARGLDKPLENDVQQALLLDRGEHDLGDFLQGGEVSHHALVALRQGLHLLIGEGVLEGVDDEPGHGEHQLPVFRVEGLVLPLRGNFVEDAQGAVEVAFEGEGHPQVVMHPLGVAGLALEVWHGPGRTCICQARRDGGADMGRRHQAVVGGDPDLPGLGVGDAQGCAPGIDDLGGGGDDPLQEVFQFHGGRQGLAHLEEHRQLGDAFLGLFLDQALAQGPRQHEAGEVHCLALRRGQHPEVRVHEEQHAVQKIVVGHREGGQGSVLGLQLVQKDVVRHDPFLVPVGHLDLAGFGGRPHHALTGLELDAELGGQGPPAADLEAQGVLALVQAEVEGLVHFHEPGQEMHHVAQALSKTHRGGEELHHLGQKG